MSSPSLFSLTSVKRKEKRLRKGDRRGFLERTQLLNAPGRMARCSQFQLLMPPIRNLQDKTDGQTKEKAQQTRDPLLQSEL